MRITVLTGGTSTERDVALASAVQVVAALRSRGHEVAVVDTGVGIKAADLIRVFEPFTQIDDRPTRERDGAGLGLTVAKRLAEALGGALAATSRPGEGSTFVLFLPDPPGG